MRSEPGHTRYSQGMKILMVFALTLCAAATSVAQTLQAPVRSVQALLDDFAGMAFLESIASEDSASVKNHLVPLGAMQKTRGVWAPRNSERFNGELRGVTWKILDGFQSLELIAELDASLAQNPNTMLKFACDARACGSSSQWANRIFGERLLYGTESSQRYRIYTITVESISNAAADSGVGEISRDTEAADVDSDGVANVDAKELDYRLLIYGSARSSSRQYLRIELLSGQLAGVPQSP